MNVCFSELTIHWLFFSYFHRAYHEREHTMCIPLTDLRSTKNDPTYNIDEHIVNFQEHFFNYHFSLATIWMPTINGVSHKHHHPPIQVIQEKQVMGHIMHERFIPHQAKSTNFDLGQGLLGRFIFPLR